MWADGHLLAEATVYDPLSSSNLICDGNTTPGALSFTHLPVLKSAPGFETSIPFSRCSAGLVGPSVSGELRDRNEISFILKENSDRVLTSAWEQQCAVFCFSPISCMTQPQGNQINDRVVLQVSWQVTLAKGQWRMTHQVSVYRGPLQQTGEITATPPAKLCWKVFKLIVKTVHQLATIEEFILTLKDINSRL